MKRNMFKLVWIMIISLFIMNSCSDSGEEEVDPCLNGPGVVLDGVIASVDGASSGEINVSAQNGKSPYVFSIDGTSFQSDGKFSNLAGGNYTITVKDANDCTNSQAVLVKEVPEVSFATEIKPIIDTNCQISNCHGSNAGIPSWATYGDIKARASAIKTRTSNKTMPPNGSLSDSDIQLIADWVDQGAPDN